MAGREWAIGIGPGAGEVGGKFVVKETYENVANKQLSKITGYLSIIHNGQV
ncbi:hypothetical protein GCM10007383_28790 [Arenibacter certesii]|uniref:Uncharacterized protein n=1 Tax=Arenibacter certesii TaxID=228955 RepID=A0A918J146_9FLAO|nr:hypothetical protein GCM10007383_28790 [Arenibacter certesii]